jgi:AmmeMemoRadiSam system protein A
METFSLTQEEKLQILKIARETIASCYNYGEEGKAINHTFDDCMQLQLKRYATNQISVLNKTLSCFVTLHSFQSGQKQLRGCIGTLSPRHDETLLKNIISNSLAAAFRDSRFEPLKADELDFIKIEISILTRPCAISFTTREDLFDKIKGKGVILESGYHRATFLPQVWEQVAQPDHFLQHLCRKAGLQEDDYLSAIYQVYEVYAFEESD